MSASQELWLKAFVFEWVREHPESVRPGAPSSSKQILLDVERVFDELVAQQAFDGDWCQVCHLFGDDCYCDPVRASRFPEWIASLPGPEMHFVYRLMVEGEVAYVGVTSHCRRRIKEHWRDRLGQFDEVRLLGPFADRVRAERAERIEISRHQPAWNKQHAQ